MNKELNKFKFVDLFAGIGGFHLAMHNVGGKCVFASEWDKYARITYEANYKQNNEITLGTEDLLGGIANTLENIEGNARGFI